MKHLKKKDGNVKWQMQPAFAASEEMQSLPSSPQAGPPPFQPPSLSFMQVDLAEQNLPASEVLLY
ncbi:hypothetical protein BV20DRAFT_1058618 [Pilatotrama ljubarskyi]|nr:hypothetical protein BV20DRAFT_1058618 [Pilatotrama ljubarskyi]